jgi:hypothetical protein
MPILFIEGFMLNTAECNNTGIPVFLDDKPPECNMMWGSDYMLMDSNAFMGGTGGSEYEKIIEMFAKIWEIEGGKILVKAAVC